MKIPDMPHRGLGEGGTRSLRQIKEEYHSLLKSLFDPNTPSGVSDRIILRLQELREEHKHLKGEQSENLNLKLFVLLLRNIRGEIERLDLDLEEDITRLEEKDPALGASLRRVRNAW